MKQLLSEKTLEQDEQYLKLIEIINTEPRGIIGLARDLTFVLAAHEEELGIINEEFTKTVTSNKGIKAYFNFLVYWKEKYGYEILLELDQDDIGINPTQCHWYRDL